MQGNAFQVLVRYFFNTKKGCIFKFAYILKYGIFLIFLPAIYIGFYPGKIVIIRSLCGILFMLFYFTNIKYWRTHEFDGKVFLNLYFIYCAITYFRGFLNIDSTKDLINLGSDLLLRSFLVPYFVYLSSLYSSLYIWKSLIKFGIPLSFITFFFPPADGMMSFAHNVTFLNVFILCIPYVKKKYIMAIIGLVILAVFMNLERRSILLNNLIPFIILIGWPILRKKNIRKYIFYLLISSPLIFLSLGVIGFFNIFEYASSLDFSLHENSARAFTVDSRTGIYTDVLQELKRKDAYLYGLGGNGKTKTSLTFSTVFDYFSLYKNGRESTESGMLNHIQYGGFLGLLSYGLLLIMAAYKALFESKNDFVKMLGLFMSFKFLYSFIEDQVQFNAHTFYIFLWIGLCYNKAFRNMSNKTITNFFNIIFK